MLSGKYKFLGNFKSDVKQILFSLLSKCIYLLRNYIIKCNCIIVTHYFQRILLNGKSKPLNNKQVKSKRHVSLA